MWTRAQPTSAQAMPAMKRAARSIRDLSLGNTEAREPRARFSHPGFLSFRSYRQQADGGVSGDEVPHSQHTNGSNTSVGGWGCRTVRLTTQRLDRRTAIFHCALEQRTFTSVYEEARGLSAMAPFRSPPSRCPGDVPEPCPVRTLRPDPSYQGSSTPVWSGFPGLGEKGVDAGVPASVVGLHGRLHGRSP